MNREEDRFRKERRRKYWWLDERRQNSWLDDRERYPWLDHRDIDFLTCQALGIPFDEYLVFLEAEEKFSTYPLLKRLRSRYWR